MSLARRLLFALVVVLGVLGALEGLARAVEQAPTPVSTIPAPAPDADPTGSLARRANEARRLAGMPARRRIPVPLAADPRVGWKLPPGTTMEADDFAYRINSDGYRGAEFTPKPVGTVRLLSLGDSTVFGDGMAEVDVLTSVAARELAVDWQSPVEAVIGALPGHSSEQAITTLNDIGPRIDPDWIVIGCLWSDLYSGDRRSKSWIDVDRELGHLAPLRSALRSHVAMYRLARNALSPWLASRKVGFIASMDDVGSLDVGPGPRVPLLSYIQGLRTLVAMAERLGARTAFIILPAPVDLDDAPLPKAIEEYRLAMREVAERADAPLVDGPRLFREKRLGIAYFFDQVHPTPEGHAVLGAALAEALAPRGPRPPP